MGFIGPRSTLNAQTTELKAAVIENPVTGMQLLDFLLEKKAPVHSCKEDYQISVRYLSHFYNSGIGEYFMFEGYTYIGNAVELFYSYLRENPSKKINTWLHDNATHPTKDQLNHFYSLLYKDA